MQALDPITAEPYPDSPIICAQTVTDKAEPEKKGQRRPINFLLLSLIDDSKRLALSCTLLSVLRIRTMNHSLQQYMKLYSRYS